MLRCLRLVSLLSGAPALSESLAISDPADSPRWDLKASDLSHGNHPKDHVQLADYQCRSYLRLYGVVATLKDSEVRGGALDVDVRTPANRGFFAFQLRVCRFLVGKRWIARMPAGPAHVRFFSVGQGMNACLMPSVAREDIAQTRQWTDKSVTFVLNTTFKTIDHNAGNRT